MTRLFIPLAATLALATAGAPAFAAPMDGEALEPAMEADAVEHQSADRKGGGNKGSSSANRNGGSSGGAHHAAPSRDNKQGSQARSAPSDRNTSSNASRPGSSGQPNAARPDSSRPGSSGQPNAARPGASPDHSRAGHASSGGHKRPSANHGNASKATPHKKASAAKHHKVTTHKRATAHKRASAHRNAVTRYRSWRTGRASHGWRWYHGVFVYPPRSRTTVHVSGGGGGGGNNQVSRPDRSLDRTNQVSVGFRTGSYISGYDDGGSFSDFGLGLQGSWRATESLALEMAYTYHDDSFDEFSERQTALIQPSVELHAFPWSRVSPYVSAGVTWAKRSYDDAYFDGIQSRTAYVQETASGPHAGLGVELGFGDRAALDIEAQYIGFLNTGDDEGANGGLQGTAGFNLYF